MNILLALVFGALLALVGAWLGMVIAGAWLAVLLAVLLGVAGLLVAWGGMASLGFLVGWSDRETRDREIPDRQASRRRRT